MRLSCLGPVNIKNCLSNVGPVGSLKTGDRDHLSNRDISYHDALATLELQSSELRLGDFILRFSKMLPSNPAYGDILPPEAPTVSRTRQKLKLVPVRAWTNHYQNSFFPFLRHYIIVHNNMFCSSTSN